MQKNSIDTAELQRIIAAALKEDIGAGDVTSQLTVSKGVRAEMRFIAGEPTIACGLFIPQAVFRQLKKKVRVRVRAREGQRVRKNTVLAVATGDARTLLAAERVILNFMQRMSGVATLTRSYVEAVKGTKAVILDTRKTMPGLRALDKYAVRAGGGKNHRMRLDDMVLIKDNHIALSGGISEAIKKIRLDSRFSPRRSRLRRSLGRGNDKRIIIECDTPGQVEEAIAAKADRILLDNMSIKTMRAAVKMAAGKIPLEASGGISLKNARAVAETGVDYLSVGRLTHSAPAADIRADVKARS